MIDYPVMLSICVPTFNHERYIKQALESIFMQKTKYSYEILVGEDKSTDNTRLVLKEIESENHYGLNVFYRKRNLNDSSKRNAIDLMDRARGKYLIFLEGDDYWTDSNKIEQQISFLENHPQYIAVSHNCIIVNEKSEATGELYQECMDNEYSFAHYLSDILPGQTASLMMRNFFYLPQIDTSFIRRKLMPGDRKVVFTLLCYGKIYCIQKSMSAYRHIVNGGNSWSANNKYDYGITRQWYKEQLFFSRKIKLKTPHIIADLLMLVVIRQGLCAYHSIDILSFFKELKNVDNLFVCSGLLLFRDFNRYILKRKVYFPIKMFQ